MGGSFFEDAVATAAPPNGAGSHRCIMLTQIIIRFRLFAAELSIQNETRTNTVRITDSTSFHSPFTRHLARWRPVTYEM
jgi:hypothetical protein